MKLIAALIMAQALGPEDGRKTLYMQGMVLRVDVAGSSILVSHGAVAGYMPAMVMPFHVRKASELEGLTPGTLIRFHLTAAGSASSISEVSRVNTRAAFVPPDSDRPIYVPDPPGGTKAARV